MGLIYLNHGGGDGTPPGKEEEMIVNTKFMPQTDKKGGRLKATDEEGRWPAVVIPYDYDLTPYGNHIKVMKAYIEKHDLGHFVHGGMMGHGTKAGYTFMSAGDKVVV
jgi:hypothetical protein